ncbi:transcriptional regulator [Lysinibacillus halotolerans]
MKEHLLKSMQRNQLVDMMYISKSGVITKRRIKINKVFDGKFNAYCFMKHANRLFCIDNVLAIVPVIQKEREVI